MSTFISVGNAKQAYPRFLSLIEQVVDLLSAPVLLQVGHNTYSHAHLECVDFLSMPEFQQRIQQSDLLILHGGAGSIITALRYGRIPIVIPRRAGIGEHIDDHQVEFVTELSKSGRILVAEDIQTLRRAITDYPDKFGQQVINNHPPLLEHLRHAIQELMENNG